MPDINDNINHTLKFRIASSEIHKSKEDRGGIKIPLDAAGTNHIVQDTGVLGRSQVCEYKGGDIEKSVREAVKLAKEQPVRLSCSEKIFDALYEYYLNSGLGEKAAYHNAALGEEEFLELSSSFCR